MNVALVSALVGTALGAGVWLTWQSLWRPRKIVSTRIAPYVSDLSASAHDVAVSNASVGVTVAQRDSATLRSLLRRAGSDITPSEWRSRRILFVLGLGTTGLTLGGAYGFSVNSVAPALGLLLVGCIAGWVMPMWAIRRRARIQRELLDDEMATGLEMLSLCLSAGEDVISALSRVSQRGSGPFSAAIRDALARVALGVSVVTALEQSSRESGSPAMARVVEHLTATLERGTPVAEVIAAQMSDVRESAKQRLIESAGRNEVVMLIPLVFLILPVTIAFAVFPGLIAIQAGV